MSITFRIALVIGALCAFAFILYKIRRSEIKVADSTFWFLFAFSFVLLALFPQIAFFCASVLGVESPANFVFLYVIAVLVVHSFSQTVELAKLREKITSLVQEEALERRDGTCVRTRTDGCAPVEDEPRD